VAKQRKSSQGAEAVRSKGPDRFFNRELSWLTFDERVLALAEDERQPLLERVKFCAICASNLDEFFQVRVAGLQVQLEAGVVADSADGRSPAEQLQAIHLAAERLVSRQERVFSKALVPALAAEGIRFADWDSLGAGEQEELEERFRSQIHPALTPLAVDPAHPFPWISNLSLNLGVVIGDRETGGRRFARVKVPPVFPRFIALGDGERLLPIEQLIRAQLGSLFPGTDIVSAHAFRVTRDANLLLDEGEADDLLSAVESGLHRRLRVNDAVRLEIEAGAEDEVRVLLEHELELGSEDVYPTRTLLDLTGLWQIHALDRPDLKDPPYKAATQRQLQGSGGRNDVLAAVRAGDVLVHHPYDSFGTSVETFVEQAAHDPDVLAIKHTLYRTSGNETNRIVRALVHAAKSGKEVVALVEIQARFDEESNIEFARSLESAGVNVVYGLVGLKTHSKVVLVIRREGEGLGRYVHLGTGNYHPDTARLYEDVGIFTTAKAIGSDVGEVFNYLTGCGQPGRFRKLLVAPVHLRNELVREIRTEMDAPDGRIVIKVNGLSDPHMIDALYEASCAGVQIDLIVRGICCLRPGIPGLSENIRVRGIVGRYLEHSRIFRFGSERRGPRYFLGSADLMTRNLDGRVEVVAPVLDPALRARIEEILCINLDPEARAWQLDAEGEWRPVPEEGGFSIHDRFQEIAKLR
jgi:polyphosphate kinase